MIVEDIENLIKRLEQMFTVQTLEVIIPLRKILEELKEPKIEREPIVITHMEQLNRGYKPVE